MRARYLLIGALSLYVISVLTVSASTQRKYWDKHPVELNRYLDIQIRPSSIATYKFKRRDDENVTSASEPLPLETLSVHTEVSVTTSLLSEVSSTTEVNLFGSTESKATTIHSTYATPTAQSMDSDRAFFTPVLPNQIELSTPTESKKGRQSVNETKKLMGLPHGAGIGIIVALILLVSIISGLLTYFYFKRRRASSWPKSNKDLQGYIDLHDVPSTRRKAHPPPMLSFDNEVYDSPLHPSMHPAVISSRGRVNSQLSSESQLEMSQGIAVSTQNARSGYPKPTIYRLSVAPMLASQPESGIASGSASAERSTAEPLPDYSFVMSAILPHTPQQDGEINVNVGDELAITDEMGPEWLVGFNLTTKSVTGGFPRKCVTGSSYH